MVKKMFFFSWNVLVFLILLVYGSASAMTLIASPNPATMGKTVTFKIGVSNPSGASNYFIVFGDSRSGLALGSHSGTTTLTTTHTYSQTGVYTAYAYSDDPDVVKPNPVYLSVRVSDFEIERLETTFENNRPEITIKQREPVPELSSKIKFKGSGQLKGYWEVDGLKRNYIFRQLSIGPEVTIKYPDIPPLPSFTPGSHVVRFVITHPALDIVFPKAVYYVTAQEYTKVLPIRFVAPQDHSELAYQPTVFKWEALPSVKFYLVQLFEEAAADPLFAAYAKTGSYYLRPQTLKSLLVPEKTYRLVVKGFDKKTRLVGESKTIGIKFKP